MARLRRGVLLSSLLFAAQPAFADSFALLKRLVTFGNRYAGAPNRAGAIGRLKRLLKDRGLTVTETPFESPDPKSGKAWKMSNLVGSFRPEKSCRFILGTHYDTRHVAEEDKDPAKRALPIPGANDGSSGVAVLLTLASRFKEIVPENVGVDLVLFDGEEMGYPDAGGYCAGSRQLASKLQADKVKPKFGIILDMVCATGGVYKREPYSMKANPKLVDALWSVGAKRLPKAFTGEQWPWIGDDHAPLSEAGVPSVLLIGMDYPQWHTQQDTLAQCSPKRLDDMVAILDEFIRKRLPEFITTCSK